MRKNDEVQDLEERLFAEELCHEGTKLNLDKRQELVNDLYSDIQLIEIREMNLKEQLKDAMTESDFLYK